MSRARDLANLSNVINKGANLQPNLIINSDMAVAQRGTSSTGVGASSNVYPTCDRWEVETGNSAGRLTMTQESDGPDGFANSIKLACTTADTSIASNEYFRLQQVIEAQNLQSLAKGSSNAKQFTLSFYVKGNATATYGIEIYDLDNTRHICTTFNVTTSWNRISLTFDGDTTGAINDDNGGGFQVGIWLHSGSDYTSGTLATSWASVTNANRSSSSNTSFFDSTSRTFFLTGVSLVVGDTAPVTHPYESFAENLKRCQRYFTKSWSQGSAVTTNNGIITASCVGNVNRAFGNVYWTTTMRTSPTVTWYNGSSGTINKWRNGSQGVDITPPSPNTAIGESGYGFVLSSGITAVTDTLQGHYEAEAEL